MAGGLSAAFKEGSEQVVHTLSGVLLSESTVQRTTEKIGQEIDQAMSAGDPWLPKRRGTGIRTRKAGGART